MLTQALLLFATSTLSAANAQGSAAPRAAWTIALYAAGDNSSEESLLPDLAALASALRGVEGVQVITLIDRSPRYSTDAAPFEQDFTDTRLYRIASDGLTRLAGAPELPNAKLDASWEANMGDVANLRGLLRFARAHYPAERTALWFYSHGDGKAFCPEETGAPDGLHPPELSAGLEARDAVDLLVLDVCSMAGVEDAYEWRATPDRFGARAMVASASVSAPFPYDRIFERFGSAAAAERKLDAHATDALAFGTWIVDAIREHRIELEKREQFPLAESYACLDLAHASDVKLALDSLARAAVGADERALCEHVRNGTRPAGCLTYAEDPKSLELMPYFDAYDFARALAQATDASNSGASSADASTAGAANAGAATHALHEAALALQQSIDALVVSSTATSAVADFERGRNGVYVVYPDGSRKAGKSRTWRHYKAWGPKPYLTLGAGGYAMHRDGAIAGDGIVQTWWERLDSWFDLDNDAAGGIDEVRW